MSSPKKPVILDGAEGEGGGQILRTALSLSLVTGRPFVLENARAGRETPGLAPQHVAAVEAAARVGNAHVEGAFVGSELVTFEPGPVSPGHYDFRIGTAGSATLVLQTVLPALLLASGPSTVSVEGGTHNPFAPPFDFLARTFAPVLSRMGPEVELTLLQRGFYPRGGGRIVARIVPARFVPLHLDEPARIVRRSARAVVEHLERGIAERELATIARELGWPERELSVEEATTAPSPGNYLALEIESADVREVVTGMGEKGLRAEIVAARAAAEARRYLEAGAPVGEHLADQLLLPLAVGAGGSFLTGKLTRHTTTNVEVIQRFLGPVVTVKPSDAGRVLVRVDSV